MRNQRRGIQQVQVFPPKTDKEGDHRRPGLNIESARTRASRIPVASPRCQVLTGLVCGFVFLHSHDRVRRPAAQLFQLNSMPAPRRVPSLAEIQGKLQYDRGVSPNRAMCLSGSFTDQLCSACPAHPVCCGSAGINCLQISNPLLMLLLALKRLCLQSVSEPWLGDVALATLAHKGLVAYSTQTLDVFLCHGDRLWVSSGLNQRLLFLLSRPFSHHHHRRHRLKSPPALLLLLQKPPSRLHPRKKRKNTN